MLLLRELSTGQVSALCVSKPSLHHREDVPIRLLHWLDELLMSAGRICRMHKLCTNSSMRQLATVSGAHVRTSSTTCVGRAIQISRGPSSYLAAQRDLFDVQGTPQISPKRQGRQVRGRMEVQALHIDRRQHLEQAWRRQEVSGLASCRGR